MAQEVAYWLTESHPYQKTPKAPKIVLISPAYRLIQEGVWRHLKAILPEWLIEEQGTHIPGWQIPTYVKMTTGGQMDFVSVQGAEDARRRIAAMKIDLVVVDEEIEEEFREELLARRLASGGREIIGATLVRSEPWLLDLRSRALAGDEDIFLVTFSTRRACEVGHVDKRVVKEAEITWSEEKLAVRLEGQARTSVGLIFPEFNAKKHIVDPFDIPKDWTRYMCIDPGWRVCGALWAAVSPGGKYVVYREFYYTGVDYKELANNIFAAEGYKYEEEHKVWYPDDSTEYIEQRWIDPSGFGHHESGELKIGNLLSLPPYNIECAPARNDRDVSIELCKRALMEDLDGVPKMRVFRTCKNFAHEMVHYRFVKQTSNSRDPPSVAQKKDDHLIDCWRYLELGELVWYPRRDPSQRMIPQGPPEIAGRPYLNQILQEEWRQLRSGTQQQTLPPHPGGLGSEY